MLSAGSGLANQSIQMVRTNFFLMCHFSRYKAFFLFASVLFQVVEVLMLCHYKLPQRVPGGVHYRCIPFLLWDSRYQVWFGNSRRHRQGFATSSGGTIGIRDPCPMSSALKSSSTPPRIRFVGNVGDVFGTSSIKSLVKTTSVFFHSFLIDHSYYFPLTGGSMIRCVYCDLACLGQDLLDKHVKQHHSSIDTNDKIKCGWCEYSTDNVNDMKCHLVTQGRATAALWWVW